MGFRKQEFTVVANQVHDSGHGDAQTVDLTNAADGTGFGNIVNPGTAATDLVVTVLADGAETSHRGTQYTIDAVTGAAFTAAGNVAAGETTRIHSDDLTLHASDGTLTFAGVSSADGYHLSLGETVTVYSYLGAGDTDNKVVPNHSVLNATNAHAASTAYTENDGMVVAAANYLGADPLTATTTRLSFKAAAGTAADDDVVLVHSSGKFKDVCRMIEAAIQAGPIGRGLCYTITDVANGITFASDQWDLGITACQINMA